ncbi:MAG: hypothetical protein EXS09_19860 [Gemmataceae bacterium]|nr:hypothetical protein [Gemmataceae bacterium]
MGRTFEVLGGRMRKAVGAEPRPALPFPTLEPDPEPEIVNLVPVSNDDLPGDDNDIPHIEVGGPRPKLHQTPIVAAPQVAALQVAAPQVEPAVGGISVAFHLLSGEPETSIGLAADLIAYHRPEHPASRQFRQLADGIAAQHREIRNPVLLFTSVTKRETGSSAVVNLAAIRAADGCGRILVIEAESGPGSAAERFGAAAMPGLRELLSRTVPITLAIHRTPVEGVHVIPEGKTRVGVEESRRLPALLEQLRHRFVWILVDGPIWNPKDLGEWAQASDGVYLVLRPEEWESPHSDAAAEGITQAGGKLRGCVTTGA